MFPIYVTIWLVGDNVQKEVVLKENMKRHEMGLNSYGTPDEMAIRLKAEKEDIRTSFFHDTDRIIYSYAFNRYMKKTQVFSGISNDHVTKRMQHVLYVSKISRTIGRALSLNEDLLEAASLGHDLGHTPYGHFGESILNEISLSVGEGYFNHNIMSVRLLKDLENKGDGLNITLQVLDAIMCHNGEFVSGKYTPKKKTIKEFLWEYQNSYYDSKITKGLIPMTLEGCVVRISDIIAYLGKDIEDACMLKKFKKSEIPKEITDILGTTNRSIVNTIIMDIIKNSLNKPYIMLSPDVYNAILALKKFNYEHIYNNAMTKEEKELVKEKFNILFKNYLEDIKNNNQESLIYVHFLADKNENYLKNTSDNRKVIDFIAGMTDDYFEECYLMIKKTI